MPNAWLALLLLVASAAACARVGEPVRDYRLELLEAGRYQVERRARQQAMHTTAGYHSQVLATLLERSAVIPLRLGTAFGLSFRLEDPSLAQPSVAVGVRIAHPPTEDYHGEPSDGFELQQRAQRGADGAYHGSVYYILSEPFELLPGRWLMEISYRGQRLQQHFDLTPTVSSRVSPP